MTRLFILFCVLCSLLIFPVGHVLAGDQDRPVLIRDAEIERMLEEWSSPVIRAAGLDPVSVKIILVQNSDMNAFVAGGQNIFLYTGLLTKTENPSEVLGVIAHELGHIAGGHLARGRVQMERASYETMLGTLLGVGVAVATGSGQAGMAVMGGAGTVAQQNFLSFSRIQESSADQAGLRFLSGAGIDPSGLVTFLDKLEDQELLPASEQNQYVRTHPISRDRIDALTSSIAVRQVRKNAEAPASWRDMHARMRAKLIGFITPEQVDWVYPKTATGIDAGYARTIADYRTHHIDRALSGVDALLAREPKNPYFHELKGQMLLDFGRVDPAITAYSRAVDLAPKEPLLRLALAQALLQKPGTDAGIVRRARDLLEQVRSDEGRNPRLYRFLATAYGRLGEAAAAQAMLAEEAFLQGRYAEARRLAVQAKKGLVASSRLARGVDDLLSALDQREKKKEKKDDGE